MTIAEMLVQLTETEVKVRFEAGNILASASGKLHATRGGENWNIDNKGYVCFWTSNVTSIQVFADQVVIKLTPNPIV